MAANGARLFESVDRDLSQQAEEASRGERLERRSPKAPGRHAVPGLLIGRPLPKLLAMGKLYSEIDERLRDFVMAQQMFFVATAPSGDSGHVNCSPKGLDSFRVADPQHVLYLDYVGSGAETIAHVRQNGRIVIMFCAFAGASKIVRLHGNATVLEPSHPEFARWFELFGRDSTLGVRALLLVELTRISDSCGFGVPLYRYEGQREQLPAWVERKGATALDAYVRKNNLVSIDGLEAVRLPNVSPARSTRE